MYYRRGEFVPAHNLLYGGAIALGDNAQIVARAHGVDISDTLGTLLFKVCGVDILFQVERIFGVNLLLVCDELRCISCRKT